ncbi:MAG: ATP-binding protein, partial [Marmoricola sp.]
MQENGSTELSRWIMRSSTDGLWIFDSAGITTYANDRLAEMLGRTPEEMHGLPVAHALDSEGRLDFLVHLDELTRSEAGRDNVERSLIRKDGSRIWGLVSHNPLLDDDGVRRGWLHRVTELTDRKLMLDRVTLSEQQLAEAQSIAKIGSWEWDILNDVVTWSDELYRIFELQPQEFEATYEGFLGHIHPEDRPRVAEAVGAAFTETEPFEFEARILKAEGRQGWMRGRGRVVRDASGAPARMGGTAQEITEAVQAAQELATARDDAMQASRMKSDFLATMSHEIRTPLNGVIGLTDLLLKTELDPAQRPLADGIFQAGRTLLGLINDVLDLSKIESGKLELEVVDFDVRAVVDQVAALMVEAVRARSVDLVVVCYPDVPRFLRGDPVRFGQVVTNLVSNAVKFTRDGPVSVRVTREGPRGGPPSLRVEVSDSGIGIAPDAQATLFEAFTQAEVSTTREYGGTGLGLTISRRLVEALGGEVGFTSELGVGSTFWFTAAFLPVPPDPASRELDLVTTPSRVSSAPQVSAVPASPPGVVLVAEDNLVNQMVARGVLEGLGYAVQFAGDGLEAVAAVTATPHRFAAVLMDCQMPRLDGYEATRAIRQLEGPGNRVPIIAMTASTVVGEKERCLESGMDDFLLKPIDFALLETTLDSWIGGRGAPDLGERDAITDTSSVLDLTRIRMLEELRPGDRSFFEQFVETFLARVSGDLSDIESAIEIADSSRLIMCAHVLKGSAQNLGAFEVGRVCQALEDIGLDGDISDAVALVPDLRRQVEV